MKFSFSKGVLPVLASLLVFVPSCEKQDEIVSVQLNESEISLEVGETHELAVTVSPEGAELIWSSSDEAIATVADGVVTAVAEGNAVITVACGDVKDECNVTVSAATIPVESVTLDMTELVLAVGATQTLTATVLPEDATDGTVVWTSSDEAVATVAEGVVTAIAEGDAVITAEAGGMEAKCALTVIEAVAVGEDENFRLVVESFFEEDGVKYVNMAWYPKDKEMVYFPFMVQASLYEGRTDEQFIEEYYATMEMSAEFYNLTFEQYLEALSLLKTGDFAGSSFVPSSEKYYGIAFGCEADGTPTTPILAVGFMG